MPEEIVMPRLSDTMQEGTIAHWHKKEGDPVKVGDVLMEVETDKATMELNAYREGTLAKIAVPDGGTAPVGTVVGMIALPGESVESVAAASGNGQAAQAPPAAPLQAAPEQAAPQPAAPQQAAPGQAAPQEAPASAQPAAPAQPPAERQGAAAAAQPGAASDVKASPLARVMAEQAGLDLRALAGQGSGPGGRIVRSDVETRVKAGGAPAPVATPPSGAPAPVAPPAPVGAGGPEHEDHELTRLRQAIARNLVLSKPGAPHIYMTVDVEMDAALSLRKQLNEAIGDDERGRLTVNDLVVKATALALRKFPELNSWFIDEKPSKVRLFRRINIGVAVPAEDGLVVPVIKDADLKSLGHIARESKDLYDRVRSSKRNQEDLSGGTFSTSNLGQFGIDEFQAVLNPPQAGILAVGAAAPKAVVRNGEVAVRTIMRATLSSDHRVVDGVYSARFLQEVKRLLEAPLSLVL